MSMHWGPISLNCYFPHKICHHKTCKDIYWFKSCCFHGSLSHSEVSTSHIAVLKWEHTKRACGCVCYYLPWMNKGFYHTNVDIMCPTKNALKYVSINIFRHWNSMDTIMTNGNFTLFYIFKVWQNPSCTQQYLQLFSLIHVNCHPDF